MPTPLGHALAGLAVAWSASPADELRRPRRALMGGLTLACVALAVLPDADLLFPPMHRAATHSIGAVMLSMILVAAVTGWVTGRISWRIAIVCGAAYASHIVTDWLGTDRNYAPYGIQMFWPFDSGWYISGWDVFPPVERRSPLSVSTIRTNMTAAAREIVILGSVVVAVWFARSQRPEGATPGTPNTRNERSQ